MNRLSTTGLWVGCFLCAILAVSWAQTLDNNLANNPGFDEWNEELHGPVDWGAWCTHVSGIALDNDEKHGGVQSLKMTTQQTRDAIHCVIQTLDVVPEQKYTFMVWVKNNKTDAMRGSATGCLSIEWKDGLDRELGRVSSVLWGKNLSRLRWELIAIKSQPTPAGAVKANFVVSCSDGLKDGCGSFFVDDVVITAQ